MSTSGWIGVDLDGTLAHYDFWRGETHVGDPIPVMLARVKAWRSQGIEVRIFTARAYDSRVWENRPMDASGLAPEPITKREAVKVVEQWCLKHIGEVLPVTCVKDFQMVELWDDRAIQIIKNTGERSDGK